MDKLKFMDILSEPMCPAKNKAEFESLGKACSETNPIPTSCSYFIYYSARSRSWGNSEVNPHVRNWSGRKLKYTRICYSGHVLVGLPGWRSEGCRIERITREINMNNIFTIIQSKCDVNWIYLQLLNDFHILHWLAG